MTTIPNIGAQRALQAISQHQLLKLFLLVNCLFLSLYLSTASASQHAPTTQAIFSNEQALAEDFGVQAMLNDLYQQGMRAFREGDRETALEYWHSAADRGHVEAQYNLGLVYSQGYGVAKNPALAALWWYKAAEHGNPAAQFNLGLMYAEGTGVDQSLENAVLWWRKSASQGFKHAIKALEVLRMHDALFSESEQLRSTLSNSQKE